MTSFFCFFIFFFFFIFLFFFFFFFFFQAEDGIRDADVTGVQTCALPILISTVMIQLGKTYGNLMVDLKPKNKKLIERAKRIIMLATDTSRSEERRVGKECRSRWSKNH